jgi:hypothetical protein
LNDPYKRDRIDGCMLDMFRFSFVVFCIPLNHRLNEVERYFGEKGLRMWVSRILGYRDVKAGTLILGI